MFEYDRKKSIANKTKHGIDFEQAKALWDDECRLEISARVKGESRFLIVGRIELLYWSAIITYRGEHIRIISVRRARKEEVTLYETI